MAVLKDSDIKLKQLRKRIKKLQIEEKAMRVKLSAALIKVKEMGRLLRSRVSLNKKLKKLKKAKSRKRV